MRVSWHGRIGTALGAALAVWVGACAAGPTEQEHVDPILSRALRSGMRAYAEDRYSAAAAAFERAGDRADALLELDGGVRIRCWKAAALIRQGEIDQALATLDEAASMLQSDATGIYPDELSRRITQLRVIGLLESRQPGAARVALDQLGTSARQRTHRRQVLEAKVAIALGDLESARSAIEELQARQDDDGEDAGSLRASLVGLKAQIAHAEGNAKLAAERFDEQAQRLLEQDDHFAAAVALGYAGRAHLEAGNVEVGNERLLRAGRALRAMKVDAARWWPLLEAADHTDTEQVPISTDGP